MPYCPNGHGEKSGAFCDECGARLTAQLSGDSLRVRSPEANATINQRIYLPGTLVRCPHCGRRNPEQEVFDCQGGCGRAHLCLRHFDEEFEVCIDCASRLRLAGKQSVDAPGEKDGRRHESRLESDEIKPEPEDAQPEETNPIAAESEPQSTQAGLDAERRETEKTEADVQQQAEAAIQEREKGQIGQAQLDVERERLQKERLAEAAVSLQLVEESTTAVPVLTTPKRKSTRKAVQSTRTAPKRLSVIKAVQPAQAAAQPKPTTGVVLPAPLRARNPLDHLRLLWWIFFTPHQTKAYKAAYGDKAIQPISSWLSSLLI